MLNIFMISWCDDPFSSNKSLSQNLKDMRLFFLRGDKSVATWWGETLQHWWQNQVPQRLMRNVEPPQRNRPNVPKPALSQHYTICLQMFATFDVIDDHSILSITTPGPKVTFPWLLSRAKISRRAFQRFSRQAFLDWIDSLRPKVVVVKRPPEPPGSMCVTVVAESPVRRRTKKWQTSHRSSVQDKHGYMVHYGRMK